MNQRRWAAATLAAALLGALSLTGTAASAAPGDRGGVYSTWTADASGIPTSADLATGFPSAAVASDDPALTLTTEQLLDTSTPPGAAYGPATEPHLAFSPLAGAATTTTLTFDSPTPDHGWSFILGDIDSETLLIAASGPGGPLDPTQLGFSGAFGGSATWDAVTGTLAAPTPDETDGSNAWFRPTVAVTSLSITTTPLQGTPVAYLWLAAQTASLAGTVTDASGAPLAGAAITLTAADGSPLPGPALPPITSDAAGAWETSLFPVPVLVSATAPDGTVSNPVPVAPEEDPASSGNDFFVYAAVSVTVVPPPTTPPPPPPSTTPNVLDSSAGPGGTLPVMGVEATVAAASAALLLLAGTTVLLVSRLRRRPSTD